MSVSSSIAANLYPTAVLAKKGVQPQRLPVLGEKAVAGFVVVKASKTVKANSCGTIMV
jgi:hypothetical protein